VTYLEWGMSVMEGDIEKHGLVVFLVEVFEDLSQNKILHDYSIIILINN
jgi:hypothetical protein